MMALDRETADRILQTMNDLANATALWRHLRQNLVEHGTDEPLGADFRDALIASIDFTQRTADESLRAVEREAGYAA